MILKSFSKINLTLSINEKIKKSRLHNIQSYYCLIDLFDEIKIKENNRKKDIISFKGKFIKHLSKTNNSITNTLRILRNNNLITKYYSISIRKKIPVFAGMGGGSSNSACLIKFLVKRKVDKNLLELFKKSIGSDLKLFFHEQGFLRNLETINVFPKKHKLYFLLVYPNIKCSTKYVYSKVNKFSSVFINNFKKINNKSKFIKFLINNNNALQSIVEKEYPIIENLILEIRQNKGCYFSRMTGSGSACYGVFKSEKTAKVALNRIKLKFPNYWATFAKTI